jgi:transcriptional regulator with XRE-family HTH domain
VPASLNSAEHKTLLRVLRELRQEAKLTQAELAERLGLPQSFVSKYEIGERRLDLVELAWIARALGVPLGEIVARFERGAK